MSYLDLVKSMTVEIKERLNLAVQTGKWPDGRALTPEQKESIVEALIAYQALHESRRDEPFTVNENGELRVLKPNRKNEHKHEVHDDVDTRQDNEDEFKLILK